MAGAAEVFAFFFCAIGVSSSSSDESGSGSIDFRFAAGFGAGAGAFPFPFFDFAAGFASNSSCDARREASVRCVRDERVRRELWKKEAARTSLESSCGMLGFGDGFFAGAFPLPFDFDF